MSKKDKAKVDQLARALVLAISRIKDQPTAILNATVQTAAERLEGCLLHKSAKQVRGLAEEV